MNVLVFYIIIKLLLIQEVNHETVILYLYQ